jgi:hypothetical protein
LAADRVLPGAAELAQPLDGQVPQLPMPAMCAEGEKLAFKELPALLDRGDREIADRCLGQELLNGLGDRRQVRLENADAPGGLPLVHDRRRGGPVARVEAASNRLAADRALDPDGH